MTTSITAANAAVATMIAASMTAVGEGCSSPFDDAACTLESRSYPIKIARDVSFPFADALKLKIEACAIREGQSPTCVTTPTEAAQTPERFTFGTSTDAAFGTLTKNETNGTIKLSATANVGEGEPSTTTIVRIRVLDDADKEVTKAEGPVRWSSESCHPTPDVTQI